MGSICKNGSSNIIISSNNDSIKYKYSAEKWSYINCSTSSWRKIYDPIIERILDMDFIFTEEREMEVGQTIRELLLNSYISCQERGDLFIDLEAYFKDDGLICHIKDDGPGFDHKKELIKRKTAFKKIDISSYLKYLDSKTHKSGGGFHCLLNYTQGFQYNDKGNEVIIKFNLYR